jgi:hypothetical protein
MAPTTTTVFLFLLLPLEIRTLIYQLLFAAPRNLTLSGKLHSFYHRNLHYPSLAILRSCKTIFLEALPILYKINNFVLYFPTELAAFAKSITYKQLRLSSIRHLVLASSSYLNATRIKELARLPNLQKMTVCDSWLLQSYGHTMSIKETALNLELDSSTAQEDLTDSMSAYMMFWASRSVWNFSSERSDQCSSRHQVRG